MNAGVAFKLAGPRVGMVLSLRGAWVQATKGLMEEKFKTGKNRWFFTKLRF